MISLYYSNISLYKQQRYLPINNIDCRVSRDPASPCFEYQTFAEYINHSNNLVCRHNRIHVENSKRCYRWISIIE